MYFLLYGPINLNSNEIILKCTDFTKTAPNTNISPIKTV